MHTSRGDGSKALTKKYLRDWNDCLADKDDFTSYEQAWLNVTGAQGHSDQEAEIAKPFNAPVDPERRKRRYDMRKDPKKGGD